MKGGITSGVIYPKLIARLASKYAFRNIGGTSAGAIAAGACAAAEYARRQGKPQSFDTLKELPDLLSKSTGDEGRSKLFSLFQPAEGLRRHFAVLVRALNAPPRVAVLGVLGGLLDMHAGLAAASILAGSTLLWPFFALLSPAVDLMAVLPVALLMMLLAPSIGAMAAGSTRLRGPAGALTWLLMLTAMVGGSLMATTGHGVTVRLLAATLGVIAVELLFWLTLMALLAVLFAKGTLAGLHGNGYGFCSGQTPADASGGEQEGLTNWLASYLNTLAGLPPDEKPLTFSDLWGHNDPLQARAIHLEIMTTAISQHMAYGIPFRDGTPPFYYDPEEWARLFPPSVMDHLKSLRAAGATSAAGAEDERLEVHSSTGRALCPLPRSADLPVVVAIRMSLSFPILLSAVPLYAIDWSLQKTSDCKQACKPIEATRVWFSDGGIGSNMPLHMFDEMLPGHPTFAVNLKPEHPDFGIAEPEGNTNKQGRIYLPEDRRGGRQRYWPAPDDKSPLPGLLGFFGHIIGTMQSWRDEIMFPHSGFRDRIIQISQRPDEGGLNLDMPHARIQALSHAGEMAAERLIDRFHPAGAQGGKGWKSHQAARLMTFLGCMQPAAAKIAPSLASGVWHAHAAGYRTSGERKLAQQLLDGLARWGQMGPAAGVSLDNSASKPLAQIKIVPRI